MICFLFYISFVVSYKWNFLTNQKENSTLIQNDALFQTVHINSTYLTQFSWRLNKPLFFPKGTKTDSVTVQFIP